jgi:hypothetical protein
VGTCCILKKTSDKQHPKLIPGETYWFILEPANAVYDQWPYNTTNASGNYAYSTDHGNNWNIDNGVLPAIEIRGK